MLSQEKKKRKRRKKKEPSPTLTSLPDDLLLSCLAYVSRLYYPTLSLVSKRFRSLLASPELYKTRSLLSLTENCLYVCIRSRSHKNPSWFTLCRKPDQTLTNDDTIENKKPSRGRFCLAKVPIPDFPSSDNSGLVAVGSSIYNICPGDEFRASSFSVLDCMSHTWREASSLPVNLRSLSASVLDRNIYVAGQYRDKDGSRKNTFQVLDTKTQIWDPMPIPCFETEVNFCYHSAFIGKKFHVVIGTKAIAYDSKEGRWDRPVGTKNMQVYIDSEETYCVVNNVLYSSPIDGVLRWYDTEISRMWLQVKGLVELYRFSYGNNFRVANYGGKMVVLWDENDDDSSDEKMIWCAEVALERRKRGDDDEMWGIVEWTEHVLTVPYSFPYMKVLAATL